MIRKSIVKLCAFLFLAMFSVQLHSKQVLQEKFLEAERGDYVVALLNKTFTLLFIYEKQGGLITIEEASLPQNKKALVGSSWQDWLTRGAPGNICWVRYRIDANNGRLVDYYSFTKGGWLLLNQADCFITTLLTLDFTPVPLNERKRVGIAPPDLPAHLDKRPFWQPPLVVESKRLSEVAFDAWKTRWPADDTFLSGKWLEVYLPSQKSPLYPSYFPYWMQIKGKVGKAQVYIINSGKALASPRPALL